MTFIKSISFLLFSLGTLFQLYGQDIQPIFKALQSNDKARIVSLLDNEVELCINEVTNFYTKERAGEVIYKYLSDAPIKKIEPIHSGSSASSKYKVAKVVTLNGEYRVFVFLNKGGHVSEIRFDKF